MNLERSALILIGFQNDYFAEDGILHSVVEESSKVTGVKANTLRLLESAGERFGLVVSTPIFFTEGYTELEDPVGILRTIRDAGAFKAGTRGAQTIEELGRFSTLIREVPGKRGLNAFSNTALDGLLREHRIDTVVLAGTVTSICIDSTGRDAFERGYRVAVLSDCTSGRTVAEQNFYCAEVFPLYAQVLRSDALTGLAAPAVAA
ncbi:cysteine hydrolase family protein [Sinimarinibacterium flocculans]|uniref:cysteine hydrolase family protein n=1 Tax=Sinimarinibacterium flocculans TaxID=985250 RepID=UPI00351646D1